MRIFSSSEKIFCHTCRGVRHQGADAVARALLQLPIYALKRWIDDPKAQKTVTSVYVTTKEPPDTSVSHIGPLLPKLTPIEICGRATSAGPTL